MTIVAVVTIFAGVLASFLVAQTLQGIIKTTLYLYAKDGKRPEGFDNVDFDNLGQGGQGRPSAGFSTH